MIHHRIAHLHRSIAAHLNLVATLLLVALLIIMAPELVQAQQATPTLVQIDPERRLTLNGPFYGLGAQDDSNLLWSGPNRAAGARVPDDFQQIVAPRLRALRMPLVRKFIDVAWFAPEAGTYTWDSPAMQALYANLRVHQANQAQVMLTIWSLPRWLSGDPQLSRNSELQPASEFPSPGSNPDYEQRWATVVSDLMRELHARGFTNVTSVGGPNEPIGFPTGRLLRPYRLLQARLAASGMNETLTLFGPDAFVNDLSNVLATPELATLLERYSFHYYAGGPDFASSLATTLSELRRVIAPTGKQIWLTEFGELEQKSDNWQPLALGAITAMNAGAGAALMWNTQDQIYNTANLPAWGLWEVYDTGYRLKPAFFAWQIMARHLPPAATVYGHNCDLAQCAGLRMAALANPAGQRAIIALNLSRQPLRLQVGLGPLASERPLQRYLLNPAALPTAATGLLVASSWSGGSGGQLLDSLPPGALAVYADDTPILPPNLASGRPASASSQESHELGPAYAVDNDPLTRWASLGAAPQWLQIDLGQRRTVTSLQIQWETAYAAVYQVQLSDDGRTWRTVAEVNNGAGGLESLSWPGQTARLLRIIAERRATPYGVSIWELAVW